MHRYWKRLFLTQFKPQLSMKISNISFFCFVSLCFKRKKGVDNQDSVNMNSYVPYIFFLNKLLLFTTAIGPSFCDSDTGKLVRKSRLFF